MTNGTGHGTQREEGFMRTVYVFFSAVMDVKRFVESISSLAGDFDLIDGRYIVDARSLMGIFSLDLTKPIQLRIQKDSKKAMQAIQEFVVDAPTDESTEDEPVATPPEAGPRVILEEV